MEWLFIGMMASFGTASHQYINSIRHNSTMPHPSTWKVFHGLGFIAVVGHWIPLVVGFFMFSWWAPVLGWLGSHFLYGITPKGIKQPGLVYVCVSIGIALLAAMLTGNMERSV